MISIIVYELIVIGLFLAVRALMPELFVTSTRVKSTAPVAARRRVGARTTTPHFIRRHVQNDPAHGAGMGMMIR